MDNRKNVFVIMPFSSTETCTEAEWTKIYEKVFKPAVEDCDYSCERAVPSRGSLIKSIIEKLKNATIVLADITDRNPNVLYELGVRHALSKCTIIVAQKENDVPSDLRGYWWVTYGTQAWEVDEFKDRIKEIMSDIEENPDKSDSPVSDYLGDENTSIKSIRTSETSHPFWGKEVEIPETGEKIGTGWLMPKPDPRDLTEKDIVIQDMVRKLGIAPTEMSFPPGKVDLRKWSSPVKHQGRLNSGAAHAAVSIVEYFERRAFGRHIDGSCLFVYRSTRDLMKVTGDTGAYIRHTLRAITLSGIPPEEQWPYTDKKPDYDEVPPTFVYTVAYNFEAVRYFCHDKIDVPPTAVLANVKRFLIAGIPSIFGFFGFASFAQSDRIGGIPYPDRDEQSQWGQAVVAVGYDDDMKIRNLKCNKETTGALLIRNSWGTGWGDKGYGWLPYDYVLNKLAMDFWSLLRMRWVDTKQFGL